MYLYAIAIYQRKDSGELAKIKACEKDTLLSSIITSDNLSKLESTTLPAFRSDREIGRTYSFEVNNEFHYVQAQAGIVMAIVSRNTLEASECAYLFRNIFHAYTRPSLVTLTSIVANPLGYNGRDVLTGRINEAVKEIIPIMQKNIDKLRANLADLKELDTASLKLHTNAIKFDQTSRKFNSCSC